MPETYDVLVAGGGPAGCLAAREAARAGARVLLVEKKRRFGALPHCAEYTSQALALELDFPSRSIVQKVRGMETRLAGETHFLDAPGFILDRQVFDHGLALMAARAGAELWAGSVFLGFDGQEARIRRLGEELAVTAGAVVAAQGAGGGLSREAGVPSKRLLVGVQFTVPLRDPLDRTVVYLDPAIQGGYAWLFPKGGEANLGLGCRPQAGAKKLLRGLREELVQQGVIGPGVLAVTGGAIPVSGPMPALAQGRVLLAGDTAGLTHPVSGAGIPQAVFSGAEAGRAAAALAAGDKNAGEEYSRAVLLRYGRNLARGMAARELMDSAWGAEGFASLMRQTWLAFKP